VRPGGGKSKGSAFERQVCKSLSLWLTDGVLDDVLWRSSLSGGRATVHAKKDKKLAHVAGDICATHPAGNGFVKVFYTECKNYADLQIHKAAIDHSGRLMQFWEETYKQASRYDKIPLLIFRQSRLPVMLGLSERGIEVLHVDPVTTFHTRPLLYLLPFATLLETEPYFQGGKAR